MVMTSTFPKTLSGGGKKAKPSKGPKPFTNRPAKKRNKPC